MPERRLRISMSNLLLGVTVIALGVVLIDANLKRYFSPSTIWSELPAIDFEAIANKQEKCTVSATVTGGMHERTGAFTVCASESFDVGAFLQQVRIDAEKIMQSDGKIEDSSLMVASDGSIGLQCHWSTDLNESFFQVLHLDTSTRDEPFMLPENDTDYRFCILCVEYRN